MIKIWKNLKIDSSLGDVFYKDEKFFGVKQKANTFQSFPFGEWVLLIDCQLMPMEALEGDLTQNQAVLSGLVFDVARGQDFYCDLFFIKNKLTNVSFGLTQSEDLLEEEIYTQLVLIKQWLEDQGVELSQKISNEEWIEYLVTDGMRLTQCYSWGTLSISYGLVEGMIKVELCYEADCVGGEWSERENH